MTHLGDIVFLHVCTHKTHIRARGGYEPTRDAAMAAFANGGSDKAWTGRLAGRFRTIQVCPKDLLAGVRQAERLVNQAS
jgi:hypothetical protein